MSTPLLADLGAAVVAQGVFRLLDAHTPDLISRLPLRQRQLFLAAQRALLYALFDCCTPTRPLARTSSPSRGWSEISAVLVGAGANLSLSLSDIQLRHWTKLISLAHSRGPRLTCDAFYLLFILPLTEELFYRRAFVRLSTSLTPLGAGLLVSLMFALSHDDGLAFRRRFLRSSIYCLIAFITGNSILASALCHMVNNLLALLLDDAMATLRTPPPPPLPRCLACGVIIGIGHQRYNCTTCPDATKDLCAKCYLNLGTHKVTQRGHVMELVPVLDFAQCIPHNSAACSASLLHSAFNLFSSRPCIAELRADAEGKLAYEWMTYGHVFTQVYTLVTLLRNHAPVGSRVLLCGGNSAAWVTSYAAVVLGGYVLCAASPTQLLEVIGRVRPVVVMCDGSTVPSALAAMTEPLRLVIAFTPHPPVSSSSNVKLLSLSAILNSTPSQSQAQVVRDFTYAQRDPEALAAIVWTSGSSGAPKGVLWSDRILRNAAQETLHLFPLVAVDFTPPHHAFALRQTLRVLCNGGQLAVIPPQLCVRLLEGIRLARPTFLGAPPAFWIELHKEFEEISQRQGPVKDPRMAQSQRQIALNSTRLLLGNRLKVALCGGSSSPPSLLTFLRECLAPAAVSDGYAATECGTVSTDGKSIPGSDIWIDRKGDSSIGEICIYSPSLCSGYLDDQAATASSFVTYRGKRYYRTGDLGERRPGTSYARSCDSYYHAANFPPDISPIYLTRIIALSIADGSIAVVGRRSASFKLPQGEFVNAERIESALEASPYIRAAYVCWHAGAQRLVGCLVASQRGRQTGWEVGQFTDEVRNVSQREQLQAYEVPQVILLETQALPPPIEALMGPGRKKPRALIATHFDPIISRHFSSSGTSNQSLSRRDLANPFTRLPTLDAMLTDVLGTTILSPSQSFASHGGDSLAAARFARRCHAEFGTPLSVANVLQLPTLYAIEAALYAALNPGTALVNITSSAPVIDWAAEMQLPADFFAVTRDLENRVQSALSSSPPDRISKHVLLTGATGFLGPFLLSALLDAYSHDIIVYCIVRAQSDEGAAERLRGAAAELSVAIPDAKWSRVRPLAGHVSRPLFGLSLEQYAQLAADVTVVYHNAAQVNGILPYSALWPANVGGALEAARLCLVRGGKHLHLISSINVLNPAADRPERPITREEALATLPIVSGYAQSKIIAESLAISVYELASSQFSCSMLSLSLHRPATISGHTLTGASNVHCFSSGVLCGLAQLGCYPAEGSLFPPFFLLTPVDFVAPAIAAIGKSQAPSRTAQTWHYVTSRPTSVADLLAELQQSGHELKAVSTANWREKVQGMIEANPLYVFKDQLMGGSLGRAHHGFGPQSINTRSHLRAIAPSITCPTLSSAVWRRYFAYLTKRGLMPPARAALRRHNDVSSVAEDPFFSLQEWYPLLAGHTPPSVWLTLSAADVSLLTHLRRALAAPLHRPRKEPYTTTLNIAASGLERNSGAVASTFSVADRDATEDRGAFITRVRAVHAQWEATNRDSASQLTALLSAIQLLVKRVADPVMGCFVRLGTRSPKDSTLRSLAHPSATASPSDPLLRAYWGMSVSTAHEVLAILLTSARVQHDLHTASLENSPIVLVARRFVSQDPRWEFRLFVSHGHLTAASVYHTQLYTEAIAARRTEIARFLADKVFPAISPLVPRDAYTVDVFLEPTLTSFLIIEINPPPPVAGTALFSLQSPVDASRLQQGPFELRVVSSPGR